MSGMMGEKAMNCMLSRKTNGKQIMVQNQEKKINEIHVTSREKARIVKELCGIIDEFKESYEEEFLLRDVIENDYQDLMTKRIEEIKDANNELSYEKLNEDKELRDLSKKKGDRA